MPVQRPHASRFGSLNTDFYDATPWMYFEQRLASLMLVAADPQRFRKVFAEPMVLGSLQIAVEPPETDEYPTPEQSFTAVESEVLLHHAAETVLRFVHAHADPDEACPWLRMGDMTGARQFKEWVKTTLAEADRSDVADLCTRVFACPPDDPAALDAYVAHVRLLARHFLDSGPYNAAKHGMGLTGGSERRQIEIDGAEVFREDGAVISWLAEWPLDDGRPRAWTRASRLFKPEVSIALINASTHLIRSIWVRGRARYLDEPREDVFTPPSPEVLFAAFGVRDRVIADWYEQLPPGEHDPHDLVVRTSHVAVHNPPPLPSGKGSDE